MALRKSLRDVDFNSMSEAELDAYVSGEETTDKFHIPEHMIPDTVKYQWVRTEVYGKPDPQNQAMMLQKGWQSVPAERHPGRWLPANATGPIIVDGLMLMELPLALHAAKLRHVKRRAEGQVHALEEQLGHAPQGTAPRDVHAKTRPTVRKNYERPIEVE